MKKVFLITLYVTFLLIAKSSFAQVTIGSNTRPADGALLELKEFAPAVSGGATATKGLLLPRLKLSEINSLVDLNGVDISEQILHTGLMIYNVSTDKCKSIFPGAYLWSGEKWNSLGGVVQYKVGTLSDNRQGDIAQKYATGHFIAIDPTTSDVLVDAGEWMLENLRAKAYDSGVTPSQPLVFSEGNSTSEAYYSYPNNDVSRFKSEGYYYSGIAALNNQLVDGVYNGSESLPSRNQQGICPDGWRIPTYEDWKMLESVMKQSECEFAFPKPKTENALGALIAPDVSNVSYTSRPVNEGGFFAFASGAYEQDGSINNALGTLPSFITTYPVPVRVDKNGVTATYPLYGSFSFTDSEKYSQFHTSPVLSMPVRCVKNDNVPTQITYDSKYSFLPNN